MQQERSGDGSQSRARKRAQETSVRSGRKPVGDVKDNAKTQHNQTRRKAESNGGGSGGVHVKGAAGEGKGSLPPLIGTGRGRRGVSRAGARLQKFAVRT